jgi:hypothetical protein
MPTRKLKKNLTQSRKGRKDEEENWISRKRSQGAQKKREMTFQETSRRPQET